MTKNIAITIGDPAGIGPEVSIKAIFSRELPNAKFFLIGSQDVILRQLWEMKMNKKYAYLKKKVKIIDVPSKRIKDIVIGSPSACSGECAIAYIDKALKLIAEKKADAIVNAPVSKKAISETGIHFSGHTEYLAKKTHSKNFCMMFVGDKIKLALVTRHLAIKEVSANLTTKKIFDVIILSNEGLKEKFSISSPRIAVCGLNPHCGENGLLGREEKDIILPAIAKATKQGIKVSGPYPAERIFRVGNYDFDLIIAMYHDQGLIPLKMLSPEAVNLTLGLPFIRTSPSHGTAIDIAGKNTADPSPMIKAIQLAWKLVSTRKDSKH